jgi:hypothetical protein
VTSTHVSPIVRSARHVGDEWGEPNASGIGLFLFWHKKEKDG